MPLFEHCNLQCLQLVSSVSSENIEISESIVSNILSVNSLCGGATSISDSIFSLFHLWSFLFAAGHRWPQEFIIYAAVAFHQKRTVRIDERPPGGGKLGIFQHKCFFYNCWPYCLPGQKKCSCNSAFGDCCVLRSIGCVTPHMMFWWAITGAGRPNSSLMEK